MPDRTHNALSSDLSLTSKRFLNPSIDTLTWNGGNKADRVFFSNPCGNSSRRSPFEAAVDQRDLLLEDSRLRFAQT